MAEDKKDKSGEDLTEDASPYRVEEFRRKGMVAQSRELSSLAALLAVAAMTVIYAPQMSESLATFMKEIFHTNLAARTDLGNVAMMKEYLNHALKVLVSTAFPVCIAGFALGALGSFIQTGVIFSWDPIMPDFEKVNPIQGFSRLFSKKQAMEGARMIAKAAIVTAVAYGFVKSEVISSIGYVDTETPGIFVSYGKVAKSLFMAIVGLLILFAVVDLGLQRFEFSKQLKMTKQEAKQEFKEREGDPQIRARIRSIQREMARKRMMQAVKKADVIITNPTHIAIAINYDREKMSAPKVVAKGADFMAQKIKEIAKDAGVPLVENVPLARTLYKTVKVGHAIPRALYQAVAEVLAYVYRIKRRTF